MNKEKERLKGAMYILDCLWNNCFYSMGKKTADRIENEFIYYLGKDWSKKIGKLTEDMELKTLKELKTHKTN